MMALDVRETYLRDRSVHSYFSRVLLDALSVPPLGQVLGVGLGHVALVLASWALLGPICFVFFEFWARLRSKLRFEAFVFKFGSILGGFWLD